MKIAIIGTGYVGLPTGVGLAELGHQVTCVDKDEAKISSLQGGVVTLFEEGLEELFAKNVGEGRLSFTTSMQEAVSEADLVIIAVGTPPHPKTKEADMKFIHAAAAELAKYLSGYTVVATKSTVPVGTGESVEGIIKKENPFADCDVISLPEFLREGFAIHDFFNPDRIVVGTDSQKARDVIKELYAPMDDKIHILYVNRRSAETIKYASNAFLAMKIHYINEMSNFCEKANADINEVALGMGMDSRIGNKFLNPGPGYGGSCFPKDTMAMAFMGRHYEVDLSLIEKTIERNTQRKVQMADRVLKVLHGMDKPKIAVLGLAFKGGTDDCRESPAMEILEELLKTSAHITVFDPKAMENAKGILGNKVHYAMDAYEAVKGADVVAVLTEWPEFRVLNLERLKKLMHKPNLVDLRNLIDKQRAVEAGFTYTGIGK